MPTSEQGGNQVADERDADTRTRAIAPAWHTAALVVLVVGVAIVGSLAPRRAVVCTDGADASRLAAYAAIAAVPWLLTAYVGWSGRRDGIERRLRALVGRVPGSAVELWADVALATGCVLAAVAIERALGGGDARHAEAVRAMLPRSGVEHAAWALVAVSVGVGEELVYRGYLMRQFAAWTGRAGAGLVLQAALFGVAHLEQGPGAAVRVGILGALLGLIALGRGSLVPAILAHVAIDLAAGFA